MKRLPFTPEMFRAWREGRKTVTRRLINPQPDPDGLAYDLVRKGWYDTSDRLYKPHYRPGERVLVVTRWAVCAKFDCMKPSLISSRHIGGLHIGEREDCSGKWRPARFVPLHLEHHFPQTTILSVRPERLQDITEEDAEREGVTPFPIDPEGDCWTDGKYRTAFEYKWGEIHGFPDSPQSKGFDFRANHLVWRYEIAPPGDDWRIG